MVGSLIFKALSGNPATPADEADVAITVSVTDVRLRSNLADYRGELQGTVSLRITDPLNGSGQNEIGTVGDLPLDVTIPCSGTPGDVGSTCSIETSADAVLPGMVSENKHAIWQMGEVRIFDGGPDELASSQEDNTLFLTQGVFVP
jgi:hypothetical protein